jgi:Na+/H+-translocating membrane pyrophosphatase
LTGLISFLSGVIISGIPITISSSNSGSAWDNTKKVIESKNYKYLYSIHIASTEFTRRSIKTNINTEMDSPTRAIFRKNSLTNAVIGDNIGDAYKDITGPCINILIKFTAYFSLIMINNAIINTN